MFQASPSKAALSDFLATFPIILPHSAEVDWKQACTQFNHLQNDEGQWLNESIVLIQRGSCFFDDKFAHVGPAVAYAVFDLDGNTNRHSNMVPGSPSASPSLFLNNGDGTLLRNYLLQRRAWNLAGASNSTSMPILTGTVNTTGPTLASDVSALAAIASAMTVTWESYGALRTWSDFLANPSIDPCLNRILGLWCERGRIIAVSLSVFGCTGTMHSAWGNLTALRYLDISGGAVDTPGMMGVVPASICALTELRAIMISQNVFTVLPECVGSMQNLLAFMIDQNQFTSLPVGVCTLPLRYADFSQNQFTTLPICFKQLRTLVYMNLLSNPMTIDASILSFRGWDSVQSIRMAQLNIHGSLSSDAFDGLTSLTAADLSGNSIEGQLPTFINCTSLQEILMYNNRFTGPLPESWSALPSLTSISVQRNRLNGTLPTVLSGALKLEVIDASYNQLTIDGSDQGDFGNMLFRVAPASLKELYLDGNLLIGAFTGNMPPAATKFNKISVAHNRLTSLPQNLFAADFQLSYLDIHNNTLGGTFPGLFPRTITLVGNPPWSLLNMRQNPRLFKDPPPTWMGTTGELLRDGQSASICPVWVMPSSDKLSLSVDATFTLYSGCTCASGYFGHSPWCVPIPSVAELHAFSLPQSAPVEAAFTTLQASLKLPLPLVSAAPNWSTFAQLARVAISNVTNTARSFSDNWYTNAAVVGQPLTLSTSWTVALQDLRRNATSLQVTTGHETVDAVNITAAALMQPVRSITLQIFVSRSSFADSVLTIANSRTIVSTITATEIGIQPTANTSTDDLSAIPSLSVLSQPLVRFVVRVAGNVALVSLTGTENTKARFAATFDYDFDCASNLRLLQTELGTSCLTSNASAGVYLSSRDGSYDYECLGVSPGDGTSLQALKDPAAVGYEGCRCSSGTFGKVPYCSLVPSAVVLSPFLAPSSSEVTHPQQFAYMTGLINSSALVSNNVTRQTQVSSNALPLALSDAWYGVDRRFQAGLSTSYDIDCRSLRHSNLSLDSSTANNTALVGSTLLVPSNQAVDSSLISADDPLQPVRYLQVRIHLDKARFTSEGTSLALYADSSRSEAALRLLGGDESIQNCKSNSTFSSSPAYQAAYGASIATLSQPCEFVAVVRGNQAILEFTSRAQSQPHFVATYSYFFVCPDGEELDSATNTCALPVRGTFNLLPVILGIAGFFVLLLFLWVVRERAVRTAAKAARDAKLAAGEDEDELSSQNLQDTLLKAQQSQLRQQLWLSLLTTVAEIGFVIVNWIDVASVERNLSDSSSDRSASSKRLDLAFTVVVVVSTTAFVVNTVSKFILVRGLWASLQELNARGVGFDELRHEFEDVQRRTTAVKITSIALLFDSAPLLALRIAQMSQYGSDATNSISLSVQLRGLVWSALLTGFKFAQMLEFKSLVVHRTKMRLAIVARNMERARVARAGRTGSLGSRPSTASIGPPQPLKKPIPPVTPTGKGAALSVEEEGIISPKVAPAPAAVELASVQTQMDSPLWTPISPSPKSDQFSQEQQQISSPRAVSPSVEAGESATDFVRRLQHQLQARKEVLRLPSPVSSLHKSKSIPPASPSADRLDSS